MKHSPAASCMECDEIITEPICPECLTQCMRAFVEEHQPELAQQMQSPASSGGEMQCLFCSQPMSICAHCISSDMYTFLAEKDESLAEEFMSRFDFDLRRTFC